MQTSQKKLLFILDSYEFYKTHREQLISFLSEIHNITVCCNILESQQSEVINSSSKNLQFKNAMFKPPTFKLTNFIHDLMISFKLIKKIDPDMIVFISPKYILIGALISFFQKMKFFFIFSCFGYLFINKSIINKFIQFIFIRILKYSSFLRDSISIVQNNDDRIFLIEKGIRNVKIIMGNGIDLKKFSVKENKVDLDYIKFIYVGRLLKDKGVFEMLEAASKILKKGYRAEFNLIGNIDNANPASISKEIINKYDIEGINFLGHQSYLEIQSYYQSNDVFVLPSYREGLPKSALEAAACGLPLILTNVEGCRECVDDGKNGFLVSPRDSGDLFNKIEVIIKNPNLINEFSNYSRKKIESNFSNEIIFSKYSQLIDNKENT
jgi:glycosyltransferase involved in cell wall biosynthesis